jgi:ADP-glucose pyrophosphorylase
VNQDLLAGRVRGVELRAQRGSFDAATHAEIDGLSLIADECIVKPGAQVVNSVLGPGVHLEERARVENSVVWAHTRVGAGAHLSGAIVGRGCHIGRAAFVGPGSALGDKTSLTDYTQTQ